MEKRLRVDRFIDSLCEDIRKPSESAMKKYYQAHRQDYMGQERVRASHIVVHVSENCSEFDAYQKIVRAKKALQEGTSFEEAAAQFSDCPDRGGDLGYFGRGQMVGEFDDVVFKMKKGEVSQVFQTSFGFHIARVTNRTPAKPLPFKSVSKTIEDKLVAERRTKRIESFLDELKEKAEIVEE